MIKLIVLLSQTSLFLSAANSLPQLSVENQNISEARHQNHLFSSIFDPFPTPMRSVKDLSLEFTNKSLLVREYTPSNVLKKRALLYFHGGGFVLGSVASYDHLCRRLAKYLDCTVYSIEYTLSPEERFPAQIEEGLSVYKWLLKKRRYDKLYVGGDSAGGNIAAALSAIAIEEKTLYPDVLLLIYPFLDLTLLSKSMSKYANGFFLTKSSLEYYRQHYLNNKIEYNLWKASPVFAKQLAKIPKKKSLVRNMTR